MRVPEILSADILEQTPSVVLEKLDELTKRVKCLDLHCEELAQNNVNRSHEFRIPITKAAEALIDKQYDRAELILRRVLAK